MTQENLIKILKFSNCGSFLGFLGILRIPEDSTRNWWGRVKTSPLPPTLRHSQMLHLRPWIVVYILLFHFCKGNFTIKMLSLIFARENQSQLLKYNKR
jgi:hypothetical protein